MKKNINKSQAAILKSRRRTLNLCFIGWIMCYLITIFADYIVTLYWDYLNPTEIFGVKLCIGVIATWIWLKQIENMDLSNWSTFNPEE